VPYPTLLNIHIRAHSDMHAQRGGREMRPLVQPWFPPHNNTIPPKQHHDQYTSRPVTAAECLFYLKQTALVVRWRSRPNDFRRVFKWEIIFTNVVRVGERASHVIGPITNGR